MSQPESPTIGKREIVAGVGLICLAAGLSMIYIPAALVVTGCVLLWFGVAYK